MSASHWTVVREVIHSTTDGAMIMSAMPGIVRRLLDEGAWREFDAPGVGPVEHGSFIEFVTTAPPKGLGGRRSQLLALCESDKELTQRVERLLREEIEPSRPRGRPSIQADNPNATRFSQPDADYVVARLKRDDPALAERVVNGELSANQAAMQAGIRRPRIVLSTPERIAASLRRHLDPDVIAELRKLLG